MRNILLVLATVAIARSAGAEPPTLIEGTITEAGSKKPLEGATVIAGGHSATTGADGHFRLEVVAGQLDVVIAYGDQVFHRGATSAAGRATQLDVAVAVDTGEVIYVDGKLREPHAPKPVKDRRILPRYSDEAALSDKWFRAWLLLDVDDRGVVTRLKLLKRPGHDLDSIAIETAFATRFEPARDRYDHPTRAYVVYSIDWPSYWWVVDLEGVVTRMPSAAAVAQMPCYGTGPLDLGDGDYIRHTVYRDCTPPPDPRKFTAQPWISPNR